MAEEDLSLEEPKEGDGEATEGSDGNKKLIIIIAAVVAVLLIAGGAAAFLLLGGDEEEGAQAVVTCLLYTSPSPRDGATSRMPSSA